MRTSNYCLIIITAKFNWLPAFHLKRKYCLRIWFVAGVLIDVLLENWRGKYDILDSRHDYIQWYTVIQSVFCIYRNIIWSQAASQCLRFWLNILFLRWYQRADNHILRLFPTRDGSRFNYFAQPLQKHEIIVSANSYLLGSIACGF